MIASTETSANLAYIDGEHQDKAVLTHENDAKAGTLMEGVTEEDRYDSISSESFGYESATSNDFNEEVVATVKNQTDKDESFSTLCKEAFSAYGDESMRGNAIQRAMLTLQKAIELHSESCKSPQTRCGIGTFVRENLPSPNERCLDSWDELRDIISAAGTMLNFGRAFYPTRIYPATTNETSARLIAGYWDAMEAGGERLCDANMTLLSEAVEFFIGGNRDEANMLADQIDQLKMYALTAFDTVECAIKEAVAKRPRKDDDLLGTEKF
jgi:hypothetical protein